MVEETAEKVADVDETPKAEAETPEGSTVESLKAQIEALELKYKKEVGDRDKGNARLHETIKQLNERLANTEKAADDLARQAFGEEEIQTEVTPYQKWKATHLTKPVERDIDPSELALKTSIKDLVPKLMGDNGRPRKEYRSAYLQAKGLYDDGDLEGCKEVLEDVVNSMAKPPEKKPIAGVSVDRLQGAGNVNKTWTRADITNMSDAEYLKNRDNIEAAIRDGRIK